MIPTRGQIKSRFLHLLDDPRGTTFLVGDGTVFSVPLGSMINLTVFNGIGGVTTAAPHNQVVGNTISIIGSQVSQLNIQTTITLVSSPTAFEFSVSAPVGTYTDPIIYTGLTPFDYALWEAYDALFTAFELAQCPRIQTIVDYRLPALTTSFTPVQAGLMDFANPEYLEERAWGSTDKYTRIEQRDKLPQRDPVNALLTFVWRLDTFFFIGATTDRDVRITYDSSGTPPVNDSDSINVDGCATFLSKYAAAIAGGRKGYDQAARYMQDAVGARYGEGIIGGELYRILQPRVRERQQVQIAPKPYSASRRTLVRSVPYIQAQSPASGGVGVPAQFSTATNTITPAPNGSNNVFYLTYPVVSIQLFVGGEAMTFPTDYSFGANVITFAPTAIPAAGQTITAWGYV